jgi:hypothetical protein
MLSRTRILAAAVAIYLALAAGGSAAQTASMTAGFTPEKLGAPTTLSLGFQLGGGELPPPLTAVDFRYPANLGLLTSGLGLASCDPVELQEHGPSTCPANSLMGHGSALIEVPVGSEVLTETAQIALLAGPSQDGSTRILISATGASPVAAGFVMPTVLLAGRLHITLPLVPSFPGAPDLSVVRIQATLGGNLTYYQRAHGKMIAYHPRGIELPKRCPRGGFRFAAAFAFVDRSTAAAHTTVACPRQTGGRLRRG